MKGRQTMYNLQDKNNFISTFAETVMENKKRNLANLDLIGFMKQDKVDLVRSSIEKIQANIISAIPTELSIPKVSLYITPTGTEEEITVISVTVTNKLKSNKKFKYTCKATQVDPITTLVEFFLGIYETLVVDEMKEANLVKVNEVIKEAVENAGLNYEVSITTDLGNKGKKISYLGDDAIVFVCDEERIFETDDILVLQEVQEDGLITEEHIEKAKAQLVEDFGKAQTPEQLIQLHGGVIAGYFCDISKHVKPMTLVKKVYNKNVLKVTGNKDTYAYFMQDNVFAVVAKREGEFEVVLSPFDIETFRKVDFDVLGAIAK